MKILIASALYPPYIKGGGEISTQLLAEGLMKNKIDVVVVTIGKEYSEEIINGVKVYRIPFKNIYWSYESNSKSNLKKIIWHTIDSYNVKIKNEFISILNKEKPDIVHSSTIEDISSYIWKICKDENIPVVHTLRSYTLLCPRATMYKNNKNCNVQCVDCKLITYPKKLLSNNVDAVVGISNFILKKHLESGYFKNSISRVIYNPYIDLNIKEFKNKEKKVLGFIGRLEKNKGIEFLLKEYLRSDFNYNLLVFGTTKDKEYERKLKNKYKDKRIMFMGQQSPKEIYNKITHLIVPSLWNEPFGRIIVEAYSQGIPVLGSNRGGIPELIEEYKTGLVFSIEENNFLEKLNKFLSIDFDKNYIRDFSKNFSVEKITNQYIDLYSKLYKDII